MTRGLLTILVLLAILPGPANAGQALEIYYTSNTNGEYAPCPT
ncbi:MAG: hypothetical protein RDU24_14670 [Humidesulfovibrio sp.]|jgi:hypothetical protein|nr:hypothetical protein [Humidesulfovibrio sp.]MDQ7836623.1 hypothetical protein [Humidesulfovibrio sp.]